MRRAYDFEPTGRYWNSEIRGHRLGGIHETERNIANKISRGGFIGAFLIQCLVAIGCSSLRLEDA